MTGTGSSVFSQAHIDAYIRKKTLELGARKYLWRKFVNKERIEQGNGATWKAIRYLRLDVPLVGLTEGVAPSETDLALEVLTCTATQYGLTVKITDILMLTIASQPLQKAIEKKADVMAALDDKLIGTQALAGVNVLYGGSATARSGLSASGGDVITTTLLRKATAALRATDGVKGRAPEVPGVGKYVGLIHEKQVFDVQKDSTWEGAAIRQSSMLEELRQGLIKEWADIAFYSSDFLPVFTNILNGTSGSMAGFTTFPDLKVDGTAVTGTRGANGLKCLTATGGSLTSSKSYAIVVTRIQKKRGYEEGLMGVSSVTFGASDTKATFTMPSDSNYVYNLYFAGVADASAAAAQGEAVTNLWQVGTNVAAGGTVVVSSLPSTGNHPPIAGPRHTSSTTSDAADVFTAFILGGDALAVVDLQDMESYMVRGPDSGNPLNQFTIIGSKFMEGTCILQDAFLQRIESQTNFGAA